MKITKVSYSKSVTKDLGNFNSVKLGFSAEAETDGDVGEATETLKEYVNSFLNEEINKYNENITKVENTRKTKEKQSNITFKGKCAILNGREYWISGWYDGEDNQPENIYLTDKKTKEKITELDDETLTKIFQHMESRN